MKGRSLRGLLGLLWILLATANLACYGQNLNQLDPKVFGYANDTSSSRIVNTGADLVATLSDVTVSTIILNDTVALSSQVWRGTITIRSRAVQIISGGYHHFEIDFGGLVNAIFVDGDGILGLYNVTTRNTGPRSLKGATGGVLYKEDSFGPWPSIVLAPGATICAFLVTFYTYSETAWQQCTLFQNYTAQSLRSAGYLGPYSITGRNSFTIEEYSDLKANVISMQTNRVVGQAHLLGSKVTIICAPDPFLGLSADSEPPTGGHSSEGVPWWVGLLCAVGALLVVVLGAWLLLFVRSRAKSAAADSEKAPPAAAKATPPEEGPAQVCHRCSEDHKDKGSNNRETAVCDGSSKDQDERSTGHVHHVTATRKPSDAASISTGIDDAPTTGPSSTNTANTNSITDMTSLPDILRARSAMLVGALELGAPLGRGSYGKVYKGKWKGVTVAVKIVEHSSEANGGIRQLRESILSSSIIHPNVVSTYKIRTIPAACAHPDGEARPAKQQGRDIGAYASDPTLEKEGGKEAAYAPDMLETWLLLEFCDRGNLDRAIMQQKSFQYSNGKPNLESMYRCLIDIAAGMDYLHSLGVINGDLKPANVLLKSTNADSRGFTCKLADFGLSRVLDTNGTHVSTQTYGTLAYQPAELLRDGKLTKAVDVYSFGMIMWELYSGRRLFENNITGQVFYKVLMGFRPPMPADMAIGYRNVMEACWQPNDSLRPTFDVILRCLQTLLDEHMHVMHGMNHMPTIQMAFSDSEASGKLSSKATASGDSTAFFNQLQAAARQARDELNLNGKASTKRAGVLSADIMPIRENSQEGPYGTDGPSSSGSYVEINSLGGTLQEASDSDVRARMHSWDRANSGRLTPAPAGPGESGSSAELEGTAGNISVWQPSPMRPSASMELSPFDAAVRDRSGGHGPPPLPGAASATAAGALDDIDGMEELRTVLAGRAARAADGESHGVVSTSNGPFGPAEPSSERSDGEAGPGRAPSTEAPMGLDDLASMMGRKPRRPIIPPPLSPPRSPAAAASSEPARCSGRSASAAAEQEQLPAAAEPGRMQELPAIPPGSLAELYLRQLSQEEAAEDTASTAGTRPSSEFLSGRSLASEPVSEQSGRRSSAASEGSALSALRSSSSGRGRPGVADVLMRGSEHSLGSSGRGACSARTSSDVRDERIIAEEQRDAPDGLAELDELFARRQRPGQQAGTLGQYTSDGFFLLRATSPADSATEVGRPPMGPQGELLRDVFGSSQSPQRHSPFSGYTAVDDAASNETAGHRISLSPARSGPVDGASRTEIEIRGRNGGPTAGAQLPQKASLHLIRRAANPGNGSASGALAAGDAVSRRGRSLPPADIVRVIDMRAKAQRNTALSLGAAPISRDDLHREGQDSSIVRVPGQTPSENSSVQNPFAFGK
ncbi:probable serine/threonine-protein kinase/receptor R826 at N-terminal half [Coccomyxa sp. Obi]|nr:probable serine/threonine-protein kinase/receptor R826 at N-terminal half [Coccomyxa sp. Obi]